MSPAKLAEPIAQIDAAPHGAETAAPAPAPASAPAEVAAVRRPATRRDRRRFVPSRIVVRDVLVVAAALAVATVGLLGHDVALIALGAAGLVALLLHRFVVHPWHVRWGSTAEEVAAPLPGDEMLEPAVVTTRAITVDAPVDQVWAWLVDLGIGPEGWCEPGLIGAAAGAERRGRIVPSLRDLGAGATRRAPGQGFEVLRIEAPTTLVSRGRDGTTWCLALRDLGSGRTRLVSRFRAAPVDAAGAASELADPVQFVRERRMLRAIRAKAESGVPMARVSSPCAP